MRRPTQDQKFDIEDGCLINSRSGEAIPADEPVFILRGKDCHAIEALNQYRDLCLSDEHIEAIEQRIKGFEDFAAKNPGRMKEPDTNPSSNNQ